MSIKTSKFGTINGKEITAFTLENKNGMSAEILNLGGVLQRLVFNGTDVVLSHSSAEDYLHNPSNLGVLVGRNSNRIANAEFVLNNKKYTLAVNNHKANLHGGIIGFSKKLWDAAPMDGDEPSLLLSLSSPDGDEGFPGKVTVQVAYTLTNENSILIHYEATSDQDTIINMTNHSYFNLDGAGSGTIHEHTLKLNSRFYTPNDAEGVPTGEILSVKGTPMDFLTEKEIGPAISSDFEQIVIVGNGLDHCFIPEGEGLRYCATLKSKKTGIKMDMYTDLPGFQIYTANFLEKDGSYKNGAKYGKHYGICLESQFLPNAINVPHFKSPILRKGETYSTTTEYKFSK